MEIILLKDKEKLGKAGDKIEVADGYARNYLIPQGFALKSTESNIKRFREIKRQRNIRKERKLKKAKELAEKIKSLSITIPVKVGEKDQVFGSVTKNDIAEQMKEKGYEVPKSNIKLEEPIRSLGIYEVPVNLDAGINTEVKVWVIKS
ncbi:MAG: 50S ribosomal protein L9 [Candidatus Marinimicrobia bacterium]|nr:50S ribosomal protein L9 [Candidatus Neomarinimicrobiota bacterium]